MAIFLAAAVLTAAAILVGQAVFGLCGTREWVHIGPLVGMATLLVLCSAAFKLPAAHVLAPAVLVMAVLTAGWVVARTAPRRRPALHVVLAIGATVAAAAVPFVASGRVALLGVSLNNDTAVHLLWAESLRSSATDALFGVPAGYPLGPHALLGAASLVTRVDVETLMTAMLISALVLIAIGAAGVLTRCPWPLRAAGATVVALSYMLTSWYGQGAFKELLHAGFLVAFAVGLHALLTTDQPRRARAAIPLGLLAAGSIQTYSYLAVAWYVGTLGLVAVAAGVLTLLRRESIVARARAALPFVGVGAAAAAIGAVIDGPRIVRYFQQNGVSTAGSSTGIHVSDIGNLAGPLPLKEAFGVWPRDDFRFPPVPGALTAMHELQLLAVIVFLGAVLWSLMRREFALPAAAGSALALYAISEGHQSPYVTAKALVILGPLVTLLSMRFLLVGPVVRDRRGLVLWAPRILVGIVLGYALMASSVKALRWMPVESTAQRDQLESFRHQIGRSPTAVLVPDDYAGWRLRGVPYASPLTGTPAPLPLEFDLGKQFVYGQGVDFDSIPPSALDRFTFVVTPRTGYGSAPPPNFHLVRQTRLLSLWRRVGRTPPRTLAEHDAASPGAPLACRHGRPVGPPTPGRALTWPSAPVVAPGPGALGAGAAVTVPLALPKGSWDISVEYTSTLPLRVQYLNRRIYLPANTNRPGPAWLAGRIRSRGGVAGILLIPEVQSRLTPASAGAQVTAVIATRVGRTRELPVRRACGRYVDRFVG